MNSNFLRSNHRLGQIATLYLLRDSKQWDPEKINSKSGVLGGFGVHEELSLGL